MSAESPSEEQSDEVVELVDIAGRNIDGLTSPDAKGKWVSLRITGVQADFALALVEFFSSEAFSASLPWEVGKIESAELVILEPAHSSEPGSGWEQAADHPRHPVYTFIHPELPMHIAKALSRMTGLDYLHLQFDGLNLNQASKFNKILLCRSDKWNSVQILRLSGLSRQASNIHVDILEKNRVPNLIGLDMGGINAGSPLWDAAARRLEGLKRLAFAVHVKEFPSSIAPTMDVFQYYDGGTRYFKDLEWLAIDEFQPRDSFDDDAEELGVHFLVKEREFIDHLRDHLPSLTRLRFTIRKKAVKHASLVNAPLSNEDIDKLYRGIVNIFQEHLPKLESICIFSDWPWYFEGGSRLNYPEKKDARDLPVRAIWPVGLRDDIPVDEVDDGDAVMSEVDENGSKAGELRDIPLKGG